MTGIKFPEEWDEQDVVENLMHYKWIPAHEVKEWLKECVANFPTKDNINLEYREVHPNHYDYVGWCKKWFGWMEGRK